MLRVFSNSASNVINKDLKLTQASAKKGFKFFPDNQDFNLIFYLPLVLLLAKQNGIFEENSGEKDPILTFGPDGGKMIFILLEEVIAL